MQDGWRNIKRGKTETLVSSPFSPFSPRRLLNSRLISFTAVLIPHSVPPFSWLRSHQSSSDHSSRQPNHFSFPAEHQKSCEYWRFIHHYPDRSYIPLACDVNITRCETKVIVTNRYSRVFKKFPAACRNWGMCNTSVRLRSKHLYSIMYIYRIVTHLLERIQKQWKKFRKSFQRERRQIRFWYLPYCD
jgi:hypothetical protein